MRPIKNQKLTQLLLQLRFAPHKQRLKQLDCAEKLLSIIEADRKYPFDFVCFRITGFHPKTQPEQELIKGDELAEDLRIFISKLSGQLACPVAGQNEKVYTVEELAAKLSISTKTIHRWRKRGLAARKFVFKDGKKRIGFTQSAVDTFLKKNTDLVSKAKNFTRLTDSQKNQLIKQARTLAADATLSRHQVIRQIAAKIGKAQETVRYTILNYEKGHPDKPIFSKPAGAMGPAAAGELFELFKQNCDIKELMKRFRRSKSSIYRIINRQRARMLTARKIEYIASDEFLEDNAREKILAEPVRISGRGAKPIELAGNSLPEYLKTLKDSPPFNRQREVELFRRYNYLKYLACAARSEVKPACASSDILKQVEKYLAEAEVIKNIIIEANLQLVVGIAGKHTAGGANLLDLISEGNFSLMRAVEKFDYTRGFRFATYASWAIAKDFARKIPAEAARPDKAPTAPLVNIQRNLRTAEAAGVVSIERASRSLIQVIKNELDEREQYIILNHFGLLGSLVKKNKKTLQQIGEDLGLTKERVRQLELIALQKLKHSLSIEEFELLTG